MRLAERLGMHFRAEPGLFEVISAPGGDEHFQAVREREALVHDRPQLSAAALAHASITCRGRELMPGRLCARCQHFLDAIPADDGCSVKVRCLFLESDPVELLMTRTADLHGVDAEDTVETAIHSLLRNGVRQLLVTSGETVLGLADGRLLQGRPRQQRLRTLVGAALPVMPSHLPLGAAGRALVGSGRRCALVVRGDRVVGLITRGDLARAGVPCM